MSEISNLSDLCIDEPLIANQDEKVSKDHCKGMEGLVSEALQHAVEQGPVKGRCSTPRSLPSTSA